MEFQSAQQLPLETKTAIDFWLLLLAFEEAVDNKAGKPRHGQAGNAEQYKEEDFKCKYGHDAILTL